MSGLRVSELEAIKREQVEERENKAAGFIFTDLVYGVACKKTQEILGHDWA